jgi:CubicO group peptidase (beta-lactamase class C family)
MLAGRVASGGFIAVSRGDQLEAFFPWGHASKSFGSPVTDRTLFHLGSAGKQMTAMAILRLELEGKVDPGKPLGTYLKDLPRTWAAVPVRHLLSHTSGIPDYTDVLTEWDRPQPRAAVIKAIGDLPLNFLPGEAWAYSNSGYLLLGWLIGEVSGQSYADYMRSLLQAAGTPLARLDAAGEIIPDRAEPYTWEEGKLVHSRRMDSSVSASSDGGVIMSARDLGPWRGALDRGRLVPREALSRALRPAALSTGRQAPYNYGFFLDRTRGQPLHHHSGSVPGFSSRWTALPRQSLSVLAVMNQEGGNGPYLGDMAYVALEAAEPGSTYVSLPAGTEDARSRALRALLQRGERAPDPGVLAPELAILGPKTRGVPRMRDPMTSLLPVESYEANGGEMVRYRIAESGGVRHMLAGWTRDEKLFWLQ